MRFRLVCLLLAVSIAGCAAAPNALPAAPSSTGDVAATLEPACVKPAPGAPDPKAPHGLMVWLDSLDLQTNQPEILKYLPHDPNLCGASIVVLWSRIDKGPGAKQQYQFGPIDAAMKPWIAAGKRVNLLFDGTNEVGPTDTATPAWVLAQTGANKVDLVPCPDPGPGSVGPPTPVYWEQGYKTPWHAFINAAIAHYANARHIGYMRFGLGAGAEDFPQHGADGNCFAAWQQYGMSAQFWATFSANLVRTIAAATQANNSSVQQVVALNPFEDPAAPFDVATYVARAAAANGVGFGTENLGSGNYGSVVESCMDNASIPYWCHAFQTYAGVVPLEFQPINFTLQPGAKVAPLPELLPYAIYNHAQIFELYPQEWLTADDPSYSTYAAHHAAWEKTLTQAAATLGG